ncbi:hydrogenase maturation nickel metallochaperone HypA [Shewanella cyperi]|uniref:Hydrogenase maturation factor HypA n=1 Tax=Shewanella cyperi TaxID=2814292 RepID=A0A974XQ56_9GAMM|nr:hydrogenase maturation nickel metallochaperone HypA [Shewanella cyperi]QSX28509.1 hydrogenase maturation nickel metallochaperone HypA [Shewanella cyperi]
MHEFSIVEALLEQCERLAREQGAIGVTQVKVQLGEVSGVEPSLLATAFDGFKLGSLCERAELELEIVPLTLACNDCGASGPAHNRSMICPQCQGINTRTLTGEELLLARLELELPGDTSPLSAN